MERHRKVFVETERLFLAEFLESDALQLFELDSNPLVHRYLGAPVLTHLSEAQEIIAGFRQQYQDYGIGRWAMIEKTSGQFLGWAGLEFEIRAVNKIRGFYDLGYRLLPAYWNRGFATEAARGALHYGFETLKIDTIFADADIENKASINVLQKVGMKWVENFDDEGYEVAWFRLGAKTWTH